MSDMAYLNGTPWPVIALRSLRVSAVVGSLLTLINQPEALLGSAEIDLTKAVLTYVVPFCVSMYAAASALRTR